MVGGDAGVVHADRVIRIGRLSEQEKDLEILVLRKQLAIAEQQLDKSVRLSQAERLTLAVISAKLKAVSGRSLKQLREVIRCCSRKQSSSGIAN